MLAVTVGPKNPEKKKQREEVEHSHKKPGIQEDGTKRVSSEVWAEMNHEQKRQLVRDNQDIRDNYKKKKKKDHAALMVEKRRTTSGEYSDESDPDLDDMYNSSRVMLMTTIKSDGDSEDSESCDEEADQNMREYDNFMKEYKAGQLVRNATAASKMLSLSDHETAMSGSAQPKNIIAITNEQLEAAISAAADAGASRAMEAMISEFAAVSNRGAQREQIRGAISTWQLVLLIGTLAILAHQWFQ